MEALERTVNVYMVGRGQILGTTGLGGLYTLLSGDCGGRFNGDGGIFNVADRISRLTIRDFPSSGFQLHIHEGEGGTAHLKTYKGEYINLSSYDAAMADLLVGQIGISIDISGLKK